MFFDEKHSFLTKRPNGENTNVPLDGGPVSLPTYGQATASSSTSFQTRFASLSLHMDDRIRLLQFPPGIRDSIRQTISQAWTRGIQEERQYGNSHEFKLHGRPWSPYGEDATTARRLVRDILAFLHEQGWVMSLSTDVSKKVFDKDTLLFRYQDPAPAPCDWACIAFSKVDRLRLIDMPTDIAQSLVQALGSSWITKHGLHSGDNRVHQQTTVKAADQHHGASTPQNVYEFKLNGYPWSASGKETMRVRELLLTLMSVLEEGGWSVYASVDQKNGTKETSETDTWHCCRVKGWTRGMPVYHN